MHINNLSFVFFVCDEFIDCRSFEKTIKTKKNCYLKPSKCSIDFHYFKGFHSLILAEHSAVLFSRPKVWWRTSHCLGGVESLCMSLGFNNWVSVGPLGAVPPCPVPLARRIQTVSFAAWGLGNTASSCFTLVLAFSISRASSGTRTPSFHFSLTLWQRGLANELSTLPPVSPWRGKLWFIPSAEVVCMHEVSSWCEWTEGMIGIRYGARDRFPGKLEQGFLGVTHGWEGWEACIPWNVSQCRVPSGFMIFLQKETKKIKRMGQKGMFIIDCSVGRQKGTHPSITNQSCSFEKHESFVRVNERIAIWETKLLPSMLHQQR